MVALGSRSKLGTRRGSLGHRRSTPAGWPGSAGVVAWAGSEDQGLLGAIVRADPVTFFQFHQEQMIRLIRRCLLEFHGRFL